MNNFIFYELIDREKGGNKEKNWYQSNHLKIFENFIRQGKARKSERSKVQIEIMPRKKPK